jgi:hypothetical protein
VQKCAIGLICASGALCCAGAGAKTKSAKREMCKNN